MRETREVSAKPAYEWPHREEGREEFLDVFYEITIVVILSGRKDNCGHGSPPVYLPFCASHDWLIFKGPASGWHRDGKQLSREGRQRLKGEGIDVVWSLPELPIPVQDWSRRASKP